MLEKSLKTLPMQSGCMEVWQDKYAAKNEKGEQIEFAMDESYRRIAKALAAVEPTKKEFWEAEFYRIMSVYGAIPGGRVTSNAGLEHRDNVSLINCLGGDTPVLTDKGTFSISDLAAADKEVNVLNGKGEWSPVVFRHYGKQLTYEVAFRYADSKSDVKIRATKGHRWLLSTGAVITTEGWLTGLAGKRTTVLPHIRPTSMPISYSSDAFRRGVLHGVVYGDGTAIVTENTYVITLFNEKRCLSEYLPTGLTPKVFPSYDTPHESFMLKSDIMLKELPPAELITPEYLSGFIAGLLATDGNAHSACGTRSVSISVTGSQETIDFLYSLAPTVGVTPTAKRLCYAEGSVSNYGIRKKALWQCTFHPSTIPLELVLRPSHLANFHQTANGANRSKKWTFQGVSKEGILEDVFCCEEPETQSFVIATGLLTGNCVVSNVVKDSIEGIGSAWYEAFQSLAGGSGIGYEFSTLRPKGAWISGVGGATSGALSFMDTFDVMCDKVQSAGGRRGAQLGSFNCDHPEIEDFIKAKREDGRLRKFNLSVLITDDFVTAVREDVDWPLVFPYTLKEIEVTKPDLYDPTKTKWRVWPTHDNYLVEEGKVACKVYKTVKARYLWDLIMQSTYDFSEPGFLLVDEINRMNNLFFCEMITATNPCGEQPLPPYGSCLLGSIMLMNFVKKPFTDDAYFDMEEFRQVVRIMSRMLDNVVELHGLRIPGQVEAIQSKRRHGLGYTGLGTALTLMGIRYGSTEAVEFTSRVTEALAVESYEEGINLAIEKGCAPELLKNHSIDHLTLEQLEPLKDYLDMRIPELLGGDPQYPTYPGKELMAHGSSYLARFAPSIRVKIAKHGCRYTHATTIAPNGTLSMTWGNNCSNGVEPSFSHEYTRNRIVKGKNTKEAMQVYSYELLAYRHLVNPDASPFATDPANKLPDYFITADELIPDEHINMQAAAQYWVDSAISKTNNVATDMPFDTFKDCYFKAYDKKLKGFTTFRFNPEAFQGVLVNTSDLEATEYSFTLEDGSTMNFKGNEEIEYEGEVHSAANLFDAIKEGYYGKL
jgi:ribonucleoside-diphosphate reductase alpha chain